MPEKRHRRRWFTVGLFIGFITFMVVLMAVQGTPGIASVVPGTAHRSGGRLLVGQTDFRMVFNMAAGIGGTFTTSTGPLGSSGRVAGSLSRIFELLHDSGVRDALGLGGTGTLSAEADSGATAVSAPANMAPGAPAASLIEIVNRSSVPVVGAIRAEIDYSKDTRMCHVLHMVATLSNAGNATQIVASGPVDQIAPANSVPVMAPGKPYELGIFVAAPRNLGNQYQAASCTVDFVLDTHQVS